MGQKQPTGTATETPKPPRTNARTWRKSAVQIVAVRTTDSGATRVEMVATATPATTTAIIRALQKISAPTTRLYPIPPRANGRAATIPEALREAAAAWIQDRRSGIPGRMTARKSRK